MPQRNAPMCSGHSCSTGQLHGPQPILQRLLCRTWRDYRQAGILPQERIQVPRFRRARTSRFIRKEPPSERLCKTGTVGDKHKSTSTYPSFRSSHRIDFVCQSLRQEA